MVKASTVIITHTNNLLVRCSSNEEILFVFFRVKLNAVSNFTACKPRYALTYINPINRLLHKLSATKLLNVYYINNKYY